MNNETSEMYSNETNNLPVVGEVVAWQHVRKSSGEHDLSYNDMSKHAVLFDSTPLVVQPTHSISAAELERLRKDAERYQFIKNTCEVTLHGVEVEDERQIDAAIAAEGEK